MAGNPSGSRGNLHGLPQGEVFVEGHLSDKDYIFSLYRNSGSNHYYWKYKGHKIAALEGMFTSKDKAIRAYTMWLKRNTKPYAKKTKERFGGNTTDSTWRLPPPYKDINGLVEVEEDIAA